MVITKLKLLKQSERRSGCMSRKRKNYEKYNIDSEADENLKIVNNMGWTRDIYCRKRDKIVHGI